MPARAVCRKATQSKAVRPAHFANCLRTSATYGVVLNNPQTNNSSNDLEMNQEKIPRIVDKLG